MKPDTRCAGCGITERWSDGRWLREEYWCDRCLLEAERGANMTKVPIEERQPTLKSAR